MCPCIVPVPRCFYYCDSVVYLVIRSVTVPGIGPLVQCGFLFACFCVPFMNFKIVLPFLVKVFAGTLIAGPDSAGCRLCGDCCHNIDCSNPGAWESFHLLVFLSFSLWCFKGFVVEPFRIVG